MSPRGGDGASPGASPEEETVPIPLTWRLLLDPPLPGPRNMALDHALAACLEEGEGALRLYGWSRPTVSFGRNEPARVLYSRPLGEQVEPRRGASSSELHYVRRPTGGRAVVHWRELTYAVIAPLDAWGGLRAAYVAINEALGAALRSLGAAVDIAASRPGPRSGPGPGLGTGQQATRGAATVLAPDAGPCFRSPAPGEVTAQGRKLIGSAQARLDGALLQHGSILLDDDQGMLSVLGGEREGVPPEDAPASLRELLGHVGIDELTAGVAMSLQETFGGHWTAGGAPGCYRPRELEAADRLESERYARDSWTWRR